MVDWETKERKPVHCCHCSNNNPDPEPVPEPNNTNNIFNQFSFVTFVILILAAWILVSVFTRYFENLFFGNFGFNSSSSWHVLIMGISLTIIFFATIWIIDAYGLIPGGLENRLSGEI